MLKLEKYDIFRNMCFAWFASFPLRLTAPMTWVNNRWADDHDHMRMVVIHCRWQVEFLVSVDGWPSVLDFDRFTDFTFKRIMQNIDSQRFRTFLMFVLFDRYGAVPLLVASSP